MYRVIFSPESNDEMRELRDYISHKRSRRIAVAYVKRLAKFCRELSIAPHRGERRPEVKADQRTIGFEGRISVIFSVSDVQKIVTIVGIRYAGRSLS